MKIIRHKTKAVKIGQFYIGGNHPVRIQSMTKTKTADIAKTVRQIKELEQAGAEIVRLAVKDAPDAVALKEIKRKTNIPLVADIHFNWRFALTAIDSGIDKIRLNPGNIYKKNEIREIAHAAELARIPIRVGVNSGSLIRRSSFVVRRSSQAEIMARSALDYVKTLEHFKFHDIVVSLKGSDILTTIEAYRLMSKLCDYPLHLGVTATGSPYGGTIKSSIALGILLSEGLGDTIRISLTEKPAQEVLAAKIILQSLGLRYFGPEVISCPTCGRCEVDLIKIVKQLEDKLSAIRYPLSATGPFKVAVMGCVVNGPGEAREADLGVAFGKREGLLFKAGRPVRKISSHKCVNVLLKEISKTPRAYQSCAGVPFLGKE